jgi:hypothetical protein
MKMPRYGFSGEPEDMRKLILFAVKAVGEPVGERELTALSLIDGNADYFLFSDALGGLLNNGLLLREGRTLCLTPRGEEVAAITGEGLPAALRRTVMDESAAVREAQMRERCVIAEVFEEDGTACFRGVLTDGRAPLLELKLQTGGEKQAIALRRRFEKDAETILLRIWETMTDTL